MYAILQVNAGAARSPDGFGHLPVELAFNSKSTAIGMVIACITTAFPDGALCEGGSDGNTMLHQGCSQEVVLSNAQAVKMVKALLAFHPETASATNLRKRLPLHVISLTDAPQAIDIMEELIERYPRGMLQRDADGNTPMHLAAAVNNIHGVRKLVEHSFRQPQHLQNSHNRFPMDCTKNRSVIKALTAPPQAMGEFKKREKWYVKVATVGSSLLLMTCNALILIQYHAENLEHLERKDKLIQGEILPESIHPRDLREYFAWCDGCGISSHLFYFIFIIALYVVWILIVVFVTIVRKCMRRSISKYFEVGWFRKHPKITTAIREMSPIMFAKSIERFIVLFPSAVVHMVACQQHPDKYWPGGEGMSGMETKKVSYEHIMQIMGFVLPILMSSQTSVIMDQSTLHTGVQ